MKRVVVIEGMGILALALVALYAVHEKMADVVMGCVVGIGSLGKDLISKVQGDK